MRKFTLLLAGLATTAAMVAPGFAEAAVDERVSVLAILHPTHRVGVWTDSGITDTWDAFDFDGDGGSGDLVLLHITELGTPIVHLLEFEHSIYGQTTWSGSPNGNFAIIAQQLAAPDGGGRCLVILEVQEELQS
jgi:hypothetical protein